MTNEDAQQSSPLDALVASAKSDRAAFGRLYEAYYERIFRYCLRRLYQRAAAEDVTSDVFLFVARKMRTFGGATEQDFRRWVYRIATTESNAYLRRTRRRAELLSHAVHEHRLPTPSAEGDRQSWEALDWPVVYQAIAQLTPREQAVVTLRLFDDLPYEEIAHAAGVRVGAARTAYSRAIARLRALLTPRFNPGARLPTQIVDP
jgi:RNA polymerase sigma-70 factor (ECF subfamily)